MSERVICSGADECRYGFCARLGRCHDVEHVQGADCEEFYCAGVDRRVGCHVVATTEADA